MKALLLSLSFIIPTSLFAEPFEFKDGDRVVFLGGTMVEREQRYGHWETALLARNPERNITVRNLGWSGDTVFCDARAGFDKPADGFRRMKELTLELKPTVILIAYGTNESFEGKEGLERFSKGLNSLIEALSPTKARIALFSPMPFEDLGRPLPDPTKANENLALYRDAIQSVAEKRKVYFADFFELMGAGKPSNREKHRTDNGMHLTDDGYKTTSGIFLKSLGLEGKESDRSGTFQHDEKLRTLVREKNELYFYRWRPQNETYLFGFRKHEQGKNAKEIVEFDPLIDTKEKQIRELLNAK